MSLLKKKMMQGFTLIELMIVVAIIGILAAVAIPKFADLVIKSKEATVKGQLGSVRSAVSIYYGDTEGVNPANLLALTTQGRYLPLRGTGTNPSLGNFTLPSNKYGNPGHRFDTTIAGNITKVMGLGLLVIQELAFSITRTYQQHNSMENCISPALTKTRKLVNGLHIDCREIS